MGKVTAVCLSEKRGTQKHNVEEAYLVAGHGLRGDAHAGNWHRQVSLLSAEKIEDFNRKGAELLPGAFGENLVVEGLDFRSMPVGTLLQCGDALLEITQIGKDCHDHCAIYQKTGECIMPREGLFARVLKSGTVRSGDNVSVQARSAPRPCQAAVITPRDRCAPGERVDKSGPAVAERLEREGYEVVEQLLLPDGLDALKKHLVRLSSQRQLDLILTTGGTGFGPRDLTPEATLAVADRQAPGIAEAIRAASLTVTKHAMLSRAVAVIRGKTLIINLPGSPKACMECMDVFLDAIPHGLALLRGDNPD